jgi:hypothetical protein
MACKVLEVESVFEGDLKEFHIHPGIVADNADLTPVFFEDDKRDSNEKTVPSYLRIVPDKAAGDVASRLSESLVPIYLRSLRLEERLTAGHCATAALTAMGGWRFGLIWGSFDIGDQTHHFPSLKSI